MRMLVETVDAELIAVLPVDIVKDIRSPHTQLQNLGLLILDGTVGRSMEKEGRTGSFFIGRRSLITDDGAGKRNESLEIKPFRKDRCDFHPVADCLLGGKGDNCTRRIADKDDIRGIYPERRRIGDDIIDGGEEIFNTHILSFDRILGRLDLTDRAEIHRNALQSETVIDRDNLVPVLIENLEPGEIAFVGAETADETAAVDKEKGRLLNAFKGRLCARNRVIDIKKEVTGITLCIHVRTGQVLSGQAGGRKKEGRKGGDEEFFVHI